MTSHDVHAHRAPSLPGFASLLAGLLAVTLLTAAMASPLRAQDAQGWNALVNPENSLSFKFLRGNEQVFSTRLGGWGPKWGWASLESKDKATGDELDVTAPFVVNKDAGQVIMVREQVRKSGDNDIAITCELSAEKDVPLTMLVLNIGFEEKFRDGDILLKHADGTESTLPLSIGGPGENPETGSLVFRSKSIGDFTATIDPAVRIINHDTLRIVLAAELFKAGKQSVTVTFHLPGAAKLLAKQSDIDQLTKVVPGEDWFPVTSTTDVKPSVIGFEDWLDKPAGKHGGVRMVGDHFEFADKTPVKFWGCNLSYAYCAPGKQEAEHTAARFAKYGVNAVRLHKFTGAGWEGIGDPNDATKVLPEGLDRFDYFANELAKNGVYYGWSHTYHFRVKPANKERLLAYDEIVANTQGGMAGDTYALINWAEDCQDLLIESVVNLLRHKNPYTGKTYAEDPVLSYIELQNEDDIFFFTTVDALPKFPTYQRKLNERFSGWLKEKYKDQAGLRSAWSDALKADESIEAKNIAVNGLVFEMGDALQNTSGGTRQRRLDNAAFLHFVQDAFYGKFVKAIRAAGYQGALCGSPWQAASGLPHYYNLLSDATVGFIDRHDYFEGSLNDTLMGHPGGGDLSMGLQQVAGRPFGVSEWIHVYPVLYSAEGPALFALYGMGLQGWSSSYEFQSSAQVPTAFSDTVGAPPYGVWNVDVPTQIGQYPALARMIARGDVKQGEVIGVRAISDKNLAEGTFDFREKVVQHGDVKTFTGDTPAEALAAGRLLVKFTGATNESSLFPDMAKYTTNGAIVSTTGQLSWDHSDKGFVTLNSAGTKAVVGFAEGKTLPLGDCSFSVKSPYASLFLTSLEKGSDLTKCKGALLTAVARNANSGMKILTVDNRLVENGSGPILMEPVKADIASGRPIAAVNVLDMDGQRTGKTLPVDAKNGFSIDSAQEKTIYYEVVYK